MCCECIIRWVTTAGSKSLPEVKRFGLNFENSCSRIMNHPTYHHIFHFHNNLDIIQQELKPGSGPQVGAEHMLHSFENFTADGTFTKLVHF